MSPRVIASEPRWPPTTYRSQMAVANIGKANNWRKTAIQAPGLGNQRRVAEDTAINKYGNARLRRSIARIPNAMGVGWIRPPMKAISRSNQSVNQRTTSATKSSLIVPDERLCAAKGYKTIRASPPVLSIDLNILILSLYGTLPSLIP